MAKRKAEEDGSSTSNKRGKTNTSSESAKKATTTRWSVHETTYLEIVLRKLVKTVKQEKDCQQQVPTKAGIHKAFIKYFGEQCNLQDKRGKLYSDRADRSYDSVESYLRKNKELKRLSEELESLCKGREGKALVTPEVTDDEILTYKESEVSEHESDGPSGGPANHSLQPATQPEEQTDKRHAKRRSRNRGMLIFQEESLPATTSQAIAGLQTAEYKVVKVEAMPSTDEDACAQHLVEHKKKNASKVQYNHENWLNETVESYKTRLTDRFTIAQTTQDRPDTGWSYELHHGDSYLNHKDCDFQNSYKRDARAASTNALINAAVLPPLGYQGCLQQLIEEQRLEDEELALATQSKAMYKHFEQKHDPGCEKRRKKSEYVLIKPFQ